MSEIPNAEKLADALDHVAREGDVALLDHFAWFANLARCLRDPNTALEHEGQQLVIALDRWQP